MVQNAFYFDAGRCTGCKTCQVACKETYTLPVQNIWRRVYDYQGGSWVADQATGGYTPKDVFGYHVSVACNHCIDPICVSSCPTGAMQKDADTGIVWTDNQVCIGCRTCESVCPYGAPSYLDDKGVMSKCNMCKEKVLDGNIPICVSGCPMRALDFGTRDDLVAKYGEGDMEIAPLPKNTTNPSTIMKPHRDAKPAESSAGGIVSFDQEI